MLDGFLALPFVTAVLARLPSCVEAATDRGRVRLHVTAPEDAGAALVWHTGARRHTEQLQASGPKTGLVLRDGLLSRPNGALVSTPDEEEVYRQLRLPFIPPELREGLDEIDRGRARRAARARLAAPTSAATCTCTARGATAATASSTWSSPPSSSATSTWRSPITPSARSPRASSSPWRFPIQREEIDMLRSRIHGIEILHGIEVDIMPDGSLDFDDSQLEQLRHRARLAAR